MKINMAIPAGALHVILSGAMPGGENWSAGFWQDHTGVSTTAQAEADAMRDLVEDNLFKLPFQNSTSFGTTCNRVTVYIYGAGGKATDIGESTVTGVSSQKSDPRLPNQIAVCITIESASRLRTGRNRCYAPATAVTIDASGQIAEADLESLVNGWASVITSGRPAVVSPKLGIISPMTAVSADRVADQQTTRRDRLPSVRFRVPV